MRIKVNIMKLLKEVNNKKSIRPQVSGIHLYKDGYIAATDGSIAFISSKQEGKPLSKDMLISFEFPSFSKTVEFGVDESKDQLVGLDKDGNAIQFIPYKVLEPKPSDFREILSRHVPSDTNVLSINPKYLKILSNFGNQCNLHIGQGMSPSYANGSEGLYIIMPMTFNAFNVPKILDGFNKKDEEHVY